MRFMPEAEVARRVNQLDNDVCAIYEILAALDQGMRAANGALLRHGNRLDTLDQKVDSLDQKVDSHGQKLDEILDLLRSSSRGNYGPAAGS